jgi:hypothetical protein
LRANIDGSCVIPADLVLSLLNELNELSNLVSDAFGLHEEKSAPQNPNVWVSIGGDRPRHRETRSNDEFPPPHARLSLDLTMRGDSLL